MQSIIQQLRRQIWGGDTSGKFTDRIGSVPLFDIMQGFSYGWEARVDAPEVNTSTHPTNVSYTHQFKDSDKSDDGDNGGNNNNSVDQVDPNLLTYVTVKTTPAQRYYSLSDVDEEDGEEFNDADNESDDEDQVFVRSIDDDDDSHYFINMIRHY
ncbi:uncharacterized protein LOC127873301 isoform X2 [Dreissena polymorpha]|uniref:uncharacterized protein LOC127873301 isoform X2 n=1 Tax=Dreissena polymorpha TaxID=45954 RepID=UPI002264F6FA|nr:uncharacterized protein LOC127873301 isoform X2 [Dreissena polymorpha]